MTVDFHDATLFAVERGDGVFVAVKPIVTNLGLDWKGQHRRLLDDPILAEGMVIMPIPSPGGAQETACLRLDLVNGWLFGIDANRLKDDIRDRVLTYKRECYAVLFRTFYGNEWAKAEEFRNGPSEPQENETVSLRLVTEARQTFGTAAAGQLWFKLGLPVVPAMRRDPRQGELPEVAA